MGKCGTAGQATGDNTVRRMHFACWITKGSSAPAKLFANVFVNSLQTRLVNVCGLLAVCSQTIQKEICRVSCLPLEMENTISLQTCHQCVVCHRQGKYSECGQMRTICIIHTVHPITVFIITNKCMS
jgi:hypothetical protein